MIHLDQEKNVYVCEGREFPRVSKILEVAGVIDTRWFKEFHALRGTYVHQATDWFDRGTLDEDSVDEELRPYFEGYKKFIKEVQPEILGIEVPLVHRALGYGTTIDRILKISGRKAVLDIKTGGLPKHVGQQTIAHKLAWNFSRIEDERVIDRYALQLPGDGKYKIHVLKDGNDLTCWMDSLTKYNKTITEQGAL